MQQAKYFNIQTVRIISTDSKYVNITTVNVCLQKPTVSIVKEFMLIHEGHTLRLTANKTQSLSFITHTSKPGHSTTRLLNMMLVEK